VTALQPQAAALFRTILLLKRYCFMRSEGFGYPFAGLLVGMAIAVFPSHRDAAARQRTNFHTEVPSKVSCTKTNVRCPRKALKTAAVKPKSRSSKQQAAAKRLDKPSKPQTAKAVAKKNIQLVVKPKTKPTATKLPKASPFFLPEIVLHVPKPEPPPIENRPNPSLGSDECRNELAKLGADFSIPAEVKGTDVCHVTDPVQLKSIATPTGRVELPGTPLLNCVFARQFVVWLSDIAAPVVSGLGAAKLASMSTGTSYQCRVRNGDFSGKMSEHAFGNAIDIAGITLMNKKRIEITAVADPEDPDRHLLMALRTSACGYFTTVLGPGADAAHASHYHFDLGVHGKNSNYRICE
jgi:hypothetical protein